MSTLHELRIAATLRERFALEVFVETGCWEGGGLLAARAAGFMRRYSCDVNMAFVEAAQAFGDVRYADSREFVRDMVVETAGTPTLWWLDAHFPEDYGVPPCNDDMQFPLIEELHILATKDGIENDVVMCDDMHALKSDDNPVFSSRIPERYHRELRLSDLARILPLQTTLLQRGTGVLIFSPTNLPIILV